MRAAVVETYEQPPHVQEMEIPTAGPDEVLLRVEAAGIHRVARARAAGRHYTMSGVLPLVPGIDGVGTDPEGRRFWFLTMADETHGSMAQWVAVPRAWTVPMPDGLSSEDAAAGANAYMAAWMSLMVQGGLAPGNRVVVLGATGAAGRATLDLLRGRGTAVAIGRNEDALDALVAQGLAERGIVLGDQEGLRDALADTDVIIDFLWGSVAESLWRTLAEDHGRTRPLTHVQVGSMAGPDAALPGAALRGTPLRVVGSGPGAYAYDQLLEQMPAVLQAMADQRLTVAHRVFPLERLAEAWAYDGPERPVLDLRDPSPTQA